MDKRRKSMHEVTRGYDKWIVLAMGPGNMAAVRVWTRKTVRFGSRTVQKPDPLLSGSSNPAPHQSSHGFHQVWLDPWLESLVLDFGLFYSWSHSDILLLIVKY